MVGDPGWTPSPTGYPLPPQNPIVLPRQDPRVNDLRWDDPGELALNASCYWIAGVNVYRSDSSDRGPYRRVTPLPVGGIFFRDGPKFRHVLEDVPWESGWKIRGNYPGGTRWVIRASSPIVRTDVTYPFEQPPWAEAPELVEVRVGGYRYPVASVFGRTGEVEIGPSRDYDPSTEGVVNFPQPGPGVEVTLSYWTLDDFVNSGNMEGWVWYRVSTVAIDPANPTAFVETPLDQCKPFSRIETELTDYIWREAVRRNGWILQQGGERVKILTRKVNGMPCSCTRDVRSLEYSRQPEAFCPKCYGVGLVGGYEGPFDTVVAPDDAPRGLSQTPWGRRKVHSYDIFLGPSPLLRQRDLVVKQTGERYSVGPCHRPTNRGNIIQQHTTLAFLDEADVRYRIPVLGTVSLPIPQTRDADIIEPRMPVTGGPSYDQQEGWAGPPYPEGPRHYVPMLTEKENTPDSLEQRGRTRPFENITY